MKLWRFVGARSGRAGLRAVSSVVLAAAAAFSTVHAQSSGGSTPPPEPAPVTAGYDKGFFIKADKFEIHFGARVQLLYQRTEPDTRQFDTLLNDEVETKPLNDFFVRRLKFYFTGFAINPAIKYKVQFDTVPFRVGGGSQGGNIRLEEAFVDLTHKPWTQVRFGQFKVPFGYEKMISSGKFNLVDRSIVHGFFGVEQEPGVNLYGQSFARKFRYDVAITQGVADNKGFNTANDVAADGDSDFRYMGRLTFEPFDPYLIEQGSVSNPDKAQLTLQLGFQSNRTAIPQDNDAFLPKDAILPLGPSDLGAPSESFDTATTDSLARWVGVSQSRKSYNRNEVEGVVAFRLKRFSVEGQAIVGEVDPDLSYLKGQDDDLKELTYDNTGLRLQSGFFLIPTKLEVAARWAQVSRDAEAEFVASPTIKESIDQTEYRAGLNWFFSKHDWKWQFDVGRITTEKKLNGEKIAVPDPASNPNKMIADNPLDNTIFRTQVQFQF